MTRIKDDHPTSARDTADGALTGEDRARDGDVPGAETASDDNLTGRGVTLGTLSYMSPEQIKALPLTPRSDVFSFGIVLHEMLTGKHPFSRDTSPETIIALMSNPPPAPENKDGKIPQKLIDIRDKALAKDPDDRYQNASEVALELSALKQALAPTKKKGIHTIGIETHPYAMLARIAKETGGTYRNYYE